MRSSARMRVKKHISSVTRRIGRIKAVLELKDRAQIGLGKAKAVALRLTDGDDARHRCHFRLTGQGNNNLVLNAAR